MKSGFLMIISSVKYSGLIKIKSPYQIRKQTNMEKNIVCEGDCLGIIHYELLKSLLTNTEDIYIQQLQRLNEKLLKKLPAFVNYQNVILTDDIARPHTERVVQETSLQFQRVCFTTSILFSRSGNDILSTFLFFTEFSE